jgi:hypothetical protein
MRGEMETKARNRDKVMRMRRRGTLKRCVNENGGVAYL